jgi:hypothetical protein
MKRGARVNASDIPNDPTFLSSNFPSHIAKAMADRIEAALMASDASTDHNNTLFWGLRDAYLRGATWRDENGSMELAEKASYDYADKMTSPLSRSEASHD